MSEEEGAGAVRLLTIHAAKGLEFKVVVVADAGREKAGPDASEAYLGDMPHPIKHRSPLGKAFKEAEDHLEQVLAERFRIKADVPEIKRVDRALLATERRALSGENWHWPELDGVEPLDLELTAWGPDEAAAKFAARYAELDAKR